MSTFPRAAAFFAAAAFAWPVAVAARQAAPAAAPAQAAPAPAPAKPTLAGKETPLGKLITNEAQGAIMSPDLTHVAVLLKKGEKYVVSRDGVDGKPHDWVVKTSIGFTGDSKVVGYIIQVGDKVQTVINGQEGKTYHEILNNAIAWGPGSRYLYFAKNDRKSKWVPVIDGVEGKGDYDNVGSIQFSAEGKRYCYAVEREEKRFFVLDGQELPSYAKVGGGSFTFSPDGQRYAYAAERDGKLTLVVDGKEESTHPEVTPVLFSADSKHYAYGVKIADSKMGVMLDGKMMKEYPLIFGDTLQFSPDSTRLAYVASRKGADGKDKLVYVIEGPQRLETKEYDQLLRGSFVFSHDSTKWCFQGVRVVPVGEKERARVVLNVGGFEGRDYDAIRMVQYSPDNQHVAYLAQRDNKMMVVVDGEETATQDGIAWLRYNKDGTKLAYLAIKGTDSFIAINDQTGKMYGGGIVPSTIIWSPDGKHIAYEARPAGENAKAVIVINQTESKDHDGTLKGTRLIWDSPTVLRALILRDKDIFKAELTAP